MRKILITGASGLLGRALVAEFKKHGWNVLGLAYSRAKGDLFRLNLHDTQALTTVIESFKPQVIIHAAAERSPDKVENDYSEHKKLNVDCSSTLAKLAVAVGAAFLFISSDYVFPGSNPPYEENDPCNPLNYYGLTKFEAEENIVVVNTDACILRIPVLYGDEEYLGESAVSSLLKNLLSPETCKVSRYEIRYPTCTDDIAVVCRELIEKKLQNPELHGNFHWSTLEAFSKYDMIKIMANVFSLSYSHILPDDEPNPSTPKPKNPQLLCGRLYSMNIGQHTRFTDGVVKYFTKFLPK